MRYVRPGDLSDVPRERIVRILIIVEEVGDEGRKPFQRSEREDDRTICSHEANESLSIDFLRAFFVDPAIRDNMRTDNKSMFTIKESKKLLK